MDYSVGSVAALISGNVTPNAPRIVKRALTPTKHQPSPNVTPKSALVDDKSIFLSPSVQKKKAIVKKSPKRIFQSQGCDATNDGDGISPLTSPKTDKIKKHLQNELDAETTTTERHKTLKNAQKEHDNSAESKSPKKKIKSNEELGENFQITNETTPKKEKKIRNSVTETIEITIEEKENIIDESIDDSNTKKSPKNKKFKRSFDSMKVDGNGDLEPQEVVKEKASIVSQEIVKNGKAKKSPIKKKPLKADSFGNLDKQNTIKNEENVVAEEPITESNSNTIPKKKTRKRSFESVEVESNQVQESQEIVSYQTKIKNKKKSNNLNMETEVNNEEQYNQSDVTEEVHNQTKRKKKNKRKKNKSKNQTETPLLNEDSNETVVSTKKSKKNNSVVNPNAITNADTDSEHDSDDEIMSETEEANKEILEAPFESSDEDEETKPKSKKKNHKPEKAAKHEKHEDESPEEEIQRTLFVGNVPLSPKCKKEIKKLFSKYGQIETVRIRTVPVKDARVTPKLAIIKNELHPDRSTVNVYVKFADPSSVDKALVENNTIFQDYHLKVTRSDTTGSIHDPKCSVFVGNLPFALEDEALRKKFENCGEIESVRIIRDKKTNAGKGFGYVNFASKDGVELALAMSEEDLTIKNRIIRVKRCTQTDKKSFKYKQRGDTSGGKHHGGNAYGGKFQGGNVQGGNFRGGMNQEKKGGFRGGGNFEGNRNDQKFGAFRRIMNKRPNQESNDGPPNKRTKNLDQPNKEKKSRKEFVGMTAEKKKKRKFDKGQKKKKALSEILNK